jgi:hypothetical protein
MTPGIRLSEIWDTAGPASAVGDIDDSDIYFAVGKDVRRIRFT